MSPHVRRPRLLLFAFLALVLGTLAAAPVRAAGPDASQDPWQILQSVRQSLVDSGPTAATFTQTYVPAGFSSGDSESGRLSLALPDCLRWDYQDPYPKGFLLCGSVAHSWNPQDKTGRRYRIDRKNEPGLDLLLLGVEDLKNRYRASARSLAAGRVAVDLGPLAGQETPGNELTDASFLVDLATRRLVEVSYHDREGNLTRFVIKDYKGLPRQGQFSPPGGIRWED
jgi:outer membrane lipoprotein-sorting protein